MERCGTLVCRSTLATCKFVHDCCTCQLQQIGFNLRNQLQALLPQLEPMFEASICRQEAHKVQVNGNSEQGPKGVSSFQWTFCFPQEHVKHADALYAFTKQIRQLMERQASALQKSIQNFEDMAGSGPGIGPGGGKTSYFRTLSTSLLSLEAIFREQIALVNSRSEWMHSQILVALKKQRVSLKSKLEEARQSHREVESAVAEVKAQLMKTTEKVRKNTCICFCDGVAYSLKQIHLHIFRYFCYCFCVHRICVDGKGFDWIGKGRVEIQENPRN